jgi:hypothetical protein
MQGAASLVVRHGQDDPQLAAWLDRIALAGEDAGWREWARRGLVTP